MSIKNGLQTIENKGRKRNPKSFPKSKKHELEEFKRDPYVKKWIENYSLKQQIRRISLLKKFSNFVEKTPTEIIEEHYTDINQKKPLDIKNTAKKQLLAFYGYLTQNKNEKFENTLNNKVCKTKISENSAKEYISSKLASFFKRNDVPIFFHKDELPSHQKEVNDKVWRNIDEIRIKDKEKRECLINIKESFNNLRDKAILLSKISSGLDDIDLFNLEVKDFFEGYYEQYNICYIEGYRKKTGIFLQTFLNGEACDAIQLYLTERETKLLNYLKSELKNRIKEELIRIKEDNLGKKLTDEEKIKIGRELNKKEISELKQKAEIRKNDWLFVSNKIKNAKYKKASVAAFSERLKETREKQGLKNITPKSLRGYFATLLKRNKIEHEIVERMMGHKFNVSMHYETLFNDVEEFAKYYSEKIEILTLLGSGNRKLTKLDDDIGSMQIENEALKEEIKTLTQKLNGTNTKVEELTELFKKLVKSKK